MPQDCTVISILVRKLQLRPLHTTTTSASGCHWFFNHYCCLYWCLFYPSRATLHLLQLPQTPNAEHIFFNLAIQQQQKNRFCVVLLLPLLTSYHSFAKVPVGGVQITCLNSSYKDADKASPLGSPFGDSVGIILARKHDRYLVWY